MSTELTLLKTKSTLKKMIMVKTTNQEVTDILSSLLCTTYDPNSRKFFAPVAEIYFLHRQLKKMHSEEQLDIMDDETLQELNEFNKKQKILRTIREDKINRQTFDFPCDETQNYLKTKLYDDQWNAVAYVHYSEGYSLINYSMGLGKTLISLAYCQYRKNVKKDSQRVLVINPNVSKDSFAKQITVHTNEKVITSRNGTNRVLDDIKRYIGENCYYFVVHYDAIRNPKILESIVNEICPNIVIIDESHSIKNLESLNTSSVLKICTSKNVESAIFMTGTAIEKTPVDIYTTQLICLPECITTNTRFEEFFTIKREFKIGRNTKSEVVGYKNLGYFREITALFSIRRSKADVKSMIPETTIDREVELSPYQKGLVLELKEIAKKIKEGEIKKGNIKELSLLNEIQQTFIRFRQISNNPAILGGKNESSKYDLLETILDEILSDDNERVLILTEFKEAVPLLGERLKKWNPIIIGDNKENKIELIEKLEDRTKNHKIMISTPYKIGIGNSLSKTSYAIYVDKPMSSIVYKQSKDRIVRRDSIGTIATFINLYSTYNYRKFVDHTIDAILLRKEKTHDAFVESKEYLTDKWDIDDIIGLLDGVFNDIT